jgi:hypothetical protein
LLTIGFGPPCPSARSLRLAVKGEEVPKYLDAWAQNFPLPTPPKPPLSMISQLPIVFMNNKKEKIKESRCVVRRNNNPWEFKVGADERLTKPGLRSVHPSMV